MPKSARGDVDQHQVNCPTPQAVLSLRRLPARQCNLCSRRARARADARSLPCRREAQLVRGPGARGSSPHPLSQLANSFATRPRNRAKTAIVTASSTRPKQRCRRQTVCR